MVVWYCVFSAALEERLTEREEMSGRGGKRAVAAREEEESAADDNYAQQPPAKKPTKADNSSSDNSDEIVVCEVGSYAFDLFVLCVGGFENDCGFLLFCVDREE